jgi:hypothetical protein
MFTNNETTNSIQFLSASWESRIESVRFMEAKGISEQFQMKQELIFVTLLAPIE